MELFTVTVDSPVIDTPCTRIGTDAKGLPDILRNLASMADSLPVGEAPAIVEIRRVK